MKKLNKMKYEIKRMKQLLKNKEIIKELEAVNNRNENKNEIIDIKPDSKITLIDIMKYIDKENYEQLFHIIYTVLSIFQTSIFPESVFSMISIFLHKNTQIQTCLNNLQQIISFSINERILNHTK